jgi:xylulokinase
LSKEELLVSLDLGTSNIKGAVYDAAGGEIAFESIEYDLHTPEDSIIENDVESYWDKIVLILVEMGKKLGRKAGDVVAISTSSQGETIVPVDKDVKPLRKAIVWIDTRSRREAQEIARDFDTREMFNKTGYPEVDPSWPATRVLWIKRNEPSIFKKTYKFLLLEDFIIYRLSGEIAGEASVYNSTYYYDIMNFDYIGGMLDYLEVPRTMFPDVVKPGTIIGEIRPEIAEITGFKRDTRIVIGALDQVCGAVGAGNVEKGVATESTGSAFAMVVTTEKPVISNEYKLPCILHAVPGLYGLMPYSSTGGMVLKWYKDRFCKDEAIFAEKNKSGVYRIMDDLASTVPAGSDGLIMLPFLTGAFFPEYDPDARGVFFGFGINHEKRHFIRAVLESLGYMMRNDIEAIRKLDIKVDKIISIGGGASSRLWSQIKSDICSIRIEVPEYTETALLGSAMLAASALGFYRDIKEASKNIMKVKRQFNPDKNNREVYDGCFRRYKDLYLNLKSMF